MLADRAKTHRFAYVMLPYRTWLEMYSGKSGYIQYSTVLYARMYGVWAEGRREREREREKGVGGRQLIFILFYFTTVVLSFFPSRASVFLSGHGQSRQNGTSKRALQSTNILGVRNA